MTYSDIFSEAPLKISLLIHCALDIKEKVQCRSVITGCFQVIALHSLDSMEIPQRQIDFLHNYRIPAWL